MTDGGGGSSDRRPQPEGRHLVIGLGAGIHEVRALAMLLNHQPGTRVNHQGQSPLPWRPLPGRSPIRERLARLRESVPKEVFGVVGTYYICYVEEAIAWDPDLRVVCLKQPREEVVEDLCRWLDTLHPLPTDHWAEQPSEGWHHDPIWTRAFPQYDVRGREDGIRRYWEEYYRLAEDLARQFPQNLRIFPARDAVEPGPCAGDALAFVGIPVDRQVIPGGLWDDVRPPAQPHPRRAWFASSGPGDARHCVVIVPHGGSIAPACEYGLRGLERRGYEVWRAGGFAAIDQGRNQLATDALVEGFQETMWIDSDVAFGPEAVDRLRSHGEPIVCGIYPQKGKRELACHVMPGTARLVFGREGGLAEILYAAGGFMLVRRQVYLRIQRQLGLPVCNERFGRPTIPFFQPLVRPDREWDWYLAEDYAFCERARRCGYRVLADTTVRLWHLGQYSYGWEDAGVARNRHDNMIINIM